MDKISLNRCILIDIIAFFLHWYFMQHTPTNILFLNSCSCFFVDILANRNCYLWGVIFFPPPCLTTHLKWCTHFITYFKTGISHRHVQTHEFPGRPEDHGWDKESDQSRSIVAGQLLRQNTGLIYGIALMRPSIDLNWKLMFLPSSGLRFSKTWSTVLT